MKNIVIIGVGRAGKTTLSNMIKDKWNQYNLIHSDSIKWGIIRGKGEEPYYRKNIKAQCSPDYIHILIGILPKYSVSEIVGYLKGKSSLIIFDRRANLKYK